MDIMNVHYLNGWTIIHRTEKAKAESYIQNVQIWNFRANLRLTHFLTHDDTIRDFISQIIAIDYEQ